MVLLGRYRLRSLNCGSVTIKIPDEYLVSRGIAPRTSFGIFEDARGRLVLVPETEDATTKRKGVR